MYRLNIQLYWSLPGPGEFADNIARAIAGARLTVVNLPYNPPQGIWTQLVHGAKGAHLGDPIRLKLADGASIEAEIATHIDPDRSHMSAHRLAAAIFPQEAVILLQPTNPEAQKRCEQYAQDFLRTCDASEAPGNCRLLLSMSDGDLPDGRLGTSAQVINFDGNLDDATMHAYVALCMTDRSGPGTTSLLQSIVSAFAGFDAAFAGRLMALEESRLLDIRNTLAGLFDEAPDRWRTRDWLRGTDSRNPDATASTNHAMYDYYLSRHGKPSVAADAARRLDKRYWRACVRAITPWLEERRMLVLKPFMAQLRERSYPKGTLSVPVGKDRTREIDPEEVEYNALTAMVAHDGLEAGTPEQRQGLAVARAAKKVRDELAHVRAPTPEMLTDLIRQMDAYCTNLEM